MNIRKPVDYSAMFAALDILMAAALPQMKLYAEIGRLVSNSLEKGSAIAAAEYLCGAYPDASGFSPRNLRRMRDFYRTYESAPETLSQAMTIGWTQNVVILETVLTRQERAWYIQAVGRFGWSKLELQRKIIANAHMNSALNFSDIACYTEETSVVAERQKTWQEGNTMADKIKMCETHFYAPSTEELAFNGQKACHTCDGTGAVRTVDIVALGSDDSLTIDEGAICLWQTLMWSLMKDIARELGIHTDILFQELTNAEKEIVFHGQAVKRHIIYQNQTSDAAGEMDFTYFNAVYTVENALFKATDEKGMKRVEKFLKQETCLDCHVSRRWRGGRSHCSHWDARGCPVHRRECNREIYMRYQAGPIYCRGIVLRLQFLENRF